MLKYIFFLLTVLFLNPCLWQTALAADPEESNEYLTVSQPENPFQNSLIIVYSVTGNTLKMAQIIQEKTGAELFVIETEETYPVGDQLIPYLKKLRDDKIIPKLKEFKLDISKYDYIFLGTPVWFHDIPAPTKVFLDQTDFAGKPVVPFVTAGGGPGEILTSLSEAIQNAEIKEAKIISRYAAKPQEDIINEVELWLESLNTSSNTTR
ncbi:MAG: NAD(P)H-dependent oxidoreductase [Deltaproteobacteria bacterium]|jgi:flavodoxin|nr:NAD(P)H-dependent oxidoreductase [Deltaproteobacteria bacterium]